jgi:NAD(P)-dependent dehydrogenase (short-subunit alcohol dehydrogenase family)
MSVAGRVCVVTGASRGLGRAIAGHLGAQGAALALCARNGAALADAADELRDRYGCRVHAEPVDVGDAAQMRAFADSTLAQLGPVSALIANAGILGPVGSIALTDPGEWRNALEVNVLGVVHAVQSFSPHMLDTGAGVILNVLGGGVGGDGVQSFIDAYVASKGAIGVLTETIAHELAPYGLRVNAFSPGPLPTELMRPVLDAGAQVAGDDLFATARSIYESAGRGDALAPEIAELIDFLLGDESIGLTGRLLSAQWNRVAQLRAEIGSMPAHRYRLRRIDGDLFLGQNERPDDVG